MEALNATGALGGFGSWIFDNPVIVIIIIAIILAVALARAATARRPVPKDERRMFSAAQKAETKRLAGGRCEHSTLGFRCKTPGAHADHIYPWSKGGATAMSNCQSLCAKHNLQKSAQVPSKFYIRRLEKRRQSYFPPGCDPKVEWRLGIAS